MKKKLVKLTEEDLHRIISESVKRIIEDVEWDTYLQQDDDEPDSIGYDDDEDNAYSDKIWDEDPFITESTSDSDFSVSMKQLYKLIRKDGFPDMVDDIVNDIYAFSNGEGAFIYNEDSMYELLRDLVNYDLICIDEMSGNISIEDSNHEDIAKLISPYVNPDMCQTVAQSF